MFYAAFVLQIDALGSISEALEKGRPLQYSDIKRSGSTILDHL